MKPTPLAAVARPAGLLVAWLVATATARAETAAGIIDSGRYRDPAAAQAAWLPMRGTAPRR